MVDADNWWDGQVRDRFAAVLQLVLGAISDDCENVEIILETINEWDSGRQPDSWEARHAAAVSRPEVVQALRELTAEGFAQAFVAHGRDFVPVHFKNGDSGEVWFYVTKKGIRAVRKFLGEE